MADSRPWVVVGRGDLGVIATVARLRAIPLCRAGPCGALVVVSDVPRAAGVVGDAAVCGLPVLAVGDGARLLARALGARVRRRARSIPRVVRMDLTDEGCVDRVLGEAPSPLDVLWCGGGGFALPRGAAALATTAADAAPAFRFRRAYGLPFHLEADAGCDRCPPGFPTDAALREGVAVLDAFARMAAGRAAVRTGTYR
jgi:GMP synthase-like glutamine amidotransferase